MVNGGTYKLTRYGDEIFLDPQAATTIPITIIPTPKTCNTTQNGITCQRWDRNWPHTPKYKPITDMHNYCASPDGAEKPWCYTIDPNVRWDYCHSNCEIIPSTARRTTISATKTITIPTKTTPTPKPVRINRTVYDNYYKIAKSFSAILDSAILDSDELSG